MPSYFLVAAVEPQGPARLLWVRFSLNEISHTTATWSDGNSAFGSACCCAKSKLCHTSVNARLFESMNTQSKVPSNNSVSVVNG